MDAKQLLEGLIKSLNLLYASFGTAIKNENLKEVKKVSYLFGQEINKYYRALGGLPKTGQSVEELVKLADFLDGNGYHALADKMDGTIYLMTKCAGHVPKMRSADDGKQEEPGSMQPRSEGTLSTRNCPDHVGTQTYRIDINSYQCPRDGKIYNYESGYTNYRGQHVPGGSIGAQTPTTSDYGGIPMRIYDSRSDVLNRVN